MTAQEVFDTVVRHLHTQGKQALSTEEDDMCVYRTADGLRCAVGCLISDEEYTPDMEGCTVEQLLDLSIATPVMHEHYALLKELQNAHDYRQNWLSNVHMGIALGNVATRMNLNASLVKELYGVS